MCTHENFSNDYLRMDVHTFTLWCCCQLLLYMIALWHDIIDLSDVAM